MVILIKRKLQNRKCLNGCLLLGIVLFIAIAACTPMFKKGSLNKLIQSKFVDYIEENNEYPAVIARNTSLQVKGGFDFGEVTGKIEGYGKKWKEYLQVPERETEVHIWLEGSATKRQYKEDTQWGNIACIPQMEEHIKICSGAFYEEEKVLNQEKGTEQGKVYPCIITEKLMDDWGMVEGEQIEFSEYMDENGNALTVQVVGIFDEINNTDIFWHVEADEFEKEFFVSESSMKDIGSRFSFNEIYYDMYMLLDYSKIHSGNIMDIEYYLKQFYEKDKKFTNNFMPLIEEYKADKKFIDTIFWVLELPVFVLLLAFVYMVSGQILSMETVEIAMLKSRGFSKKQIVFLYMCQSGVLAGFGILLGLPLGYLICRLSASTNAFLEFSMKSTAIYKPTVGMLAYAMVAALIVLAFMTLPVIGYSKYSIVQQKSQKADFHSAGFVEKYFLDVILFLFSSYLLYNYNKQKQLLAWDVMTGEKLDPMVFLNVSLFLLACGLVGLRLIKYMVRLVYHLGRNKWKPHMYASFLQIMRTTGKQNFISVFLVFTIAMGIFNANVAGTINKNNELRTRYNVGADVVAAEQWDIQVYYDSSSKQARRYYTEPDYERFTEFTKDICNGMTRVVRDDDVKVSSSGKTQEGCSMMAVNTKEFGETAKLPDGLNKEHWYNYLNALAQTGSGVLISQNMAEDFNLKVGDSVNYTRNDPLSSSADNEMVTCNGIVCGIFNAWPGYEQYSYGYDENEEWVEKQQYMIVVNYAYEVNVFGASPYEIWMDLKDKVSVSDVRDSLSAQNIEMRFVTGAEENVKEIRDSAMIQITNGLFTLSFLVSVILCTVGFLIYWITSIKQRELLFGIYRAMGMSMKEVNKMLLNEQIFSSFLAGVMGGITGLGTTFLSAKIVAVVYLPQSHNIALQTFIDGINMSRLLGIVLVMIVICLMVLRYILKNSSITQAIKMGED